MRRAGSTAASRMALRLVLPSQVDISFGGPCGTILPPSPPPASRGANATAPPARSILLDLSNPLLRLDESAVYQSLWVTGYPLRGQGLRTSTLYVTVLRVRLSCTHARAGPVQDAAACLLS